MFIIFWCFVYFVFGAVLSIPYCLAAGWDRGFFSIMTLAMPFLLFVWLLAAVFVGVVEIPPSGIHFKNAFRRERKESSRVPLAIFWIWTVYSTLPIILHWTARLVGRFWSGPVAAFIEAHRFESLIYVFWAVMAAFLVLMVYGGIAGALVGLLVSRKAATPKSG